jgi:6-phosphogluconolactonase
MIEGGYLCHITYSSRNKALFGACYETGTVFSVRVEKGRFGELLYHEVQTGDNPQALTRAHYVLLNQEETTLVTVNIALDRIYFYDLKDGYLMFRDALELPKGIGPRHALFSGDEKLLYVITEYSNEILLYRTEDNRLLQRISTLDETYTGVSNCSTLCFSKDRQYLYAANRGAQTVTLFHMAQDGTLTRLQEYDCGGLHPRHMIITEDGEYMVICNQNSDNAAIYELDTSNGGLKKLLVSIPFPAPGGIMEI